jgi:hypothetical protein
MKYSHVRLIIKVTRLLQDLKIIPAVFGEIHYLGKNEYVLYDKYK